MFTRCLFAACVAVVLSPVLMRRGPVPSDDGALAERSSPRPTRSPAALAELLKTRDALVARRATAAPAERPKIDREIAALEPAIDEIGGQRYCSTSRLFWHTDFAEALAAARETGKPVLSLRMMGKLTDECSCANSRFFRATLYANREIADLMRDRFILHWGSVRPVPTITVDFGDGRKLHRTLTGNSIHYALDSRGRLLDGLPGLNSPERFQQWLTEVSAIASTTGTVSDDRRFRQLMSLTHVSLLEEIARSWQLDVQRAGTQPMPGVYTVATPPAELASDRAMTKAVAEMPTLPSVTARLTHLERQPGSDAWERLGALHASEVRFDADTLSFIESLNPLAGRKAEAREEEFARLIQRLQRSVAIDTVRNEYDLHRRIHQWLAEGSNQWLPEASKLPEIEAFNERVYDELFLTPSRDPWVGLRPEDAFAALANDGVED